MLNNTANDAKFVMNKTSKVLCIAVILLIALTGCKFNQAKYASELITETYSAAQAKELKKAAEDGDVTFSMFKRSFNAQCVRKTHQGYYAVLFLNDGGNAFVFFDEKSMLKSVMISYGFKSETEFRNHVTEHMRKSEVLNYDTNSITLPVSAVDTTAHIVQEGVFIVKYSRFENGKIIDDPIVTSIVFVKNEEIATNEDLFIRNEIPFILEIDRDKQSTEIGNATNDKTSEVLCIEKGEYFEVYRNSRADIYFYIVKNSKNEYLDFGYHDGRGSLKFFKSNGLLCLEYGVGGPTWYERYYDIEKGKVSKFFAMPYLGYNNLVAYFSLADNVVCLFVEDVFDSNIRYEVKRGFPRSVLREKVKLNFVEMNKIHVEYNDENGDSISEVIGF